MTKGNQDITFESIHFTISKYYLIQQKEIIMKVKQFEGTDFRYDGLYWSKKFKCWKSGSDRNGYKLVGLNGKMGSLHRIIATLFIPNDNPEYTVVNHKNRDRSDNRVDNLEWCTQRMNCQNKSNQSKYGVNIQETPFGKFQVMVRISGKRKHLGNFETPEEAEIERDKVFLEQGLEVNK